MAAPQVAERHDRHHRHAQNQSAAAHEGHGGYDHAAMVADFRPRFWVSLILTVPASLRSGSRSTLLWNVW